VPEQEHRLEEWDQTEVGQPQQHRIIGPEELISEHRGLGKGVVP